MIVLPSPATIPFRKIYLNRYFELNLQSYLPPSTKVKMKSSNPAICVAILAAASIVGAAPMPTGKTFKSVPDVHMDQLCSQYSRSEA